jgi:signal transduction histidine kinase
VDTRDRGIRFANPAAGRFRGIPPGTDDATCRLALQDGSLVEVEIGRGPVGDLEVVVARDVGAGGLETPCLSAFGDGSVPRGDPVLRRVVERAGMGIAELDCETGRFTWSAAFTAGLGHAPVPEGRALAFWLASMHPEDRGRVVAGYEALFASSATMGRQLYRLRRSDGSDAWIEEKVELERHADGRVLRVVMLMNVTEQRSPEPGDHAAKMLAEICHDLRQPLNGMELTVDALSLLYREAGRGREPDAGEVALLLDGARTSVRVMTALCDHLVDLRMLERGGFVPRPETVPLGPLLQQVCTVHAPLAREKGLRLRFVPTPATAVVDPILLMRAVSNLIGNAVENTRTGGVTVRCRRRGGDVRIDVRDTGPGLPDDAPGPGDPLEAAARAVARIRLGHGLGLAVVRCCAAQMGAAIEVATTRGRGTCVSLLLPAGLLPAGDDLRA